MEPEVDDLIILLQGMGARIKRGNGKTIIIEGVKKLYGTDFTVMPDRNEAVTFAIGAVATGGDLVIHGARKRDLTAFLENSEKVGVGFKVLDEETVRFYSSGNKIRPSKIVTGPHPGFMTDLQAPRTPFVTEVNGISTVHETVFEDRFSFVNELVKIGADIEGFTPEVKNPEKVYNFNWSDRRDG